MTVFMFSLAGIPPMVGFFAKLAVIQALVTTNVPFYIFLAVVAVVLSLIGAFYYLRVVKVMWFDEPSQTAPVLVGRPDGDVPRRHRQGPGRLNGPPPWRPTTNI